MNEDKVVEIDWSEKPKITGGSEKKTSTLYENWSHLAKKKVDFEDKVIQEQIKKGNYPNLKTGHEQGCTCQYCMPEENCFVKREKGLLDIVPPEVVGYKNLGKPKYTPSGEVIEYLDLGDVTEDEIGQVKEEHDDIHRMDYVQSDAPAFFGKKTMAHPKPDTLLPVDILTKWTNVLAEEEKEKQRELVKSLKKSKWIELTVNNFPMAFNTEQISAISDQGHGAMIHLEGIIYQAQESYDDVLKMAREAE